MDDTYREPRDDDPQGGYDVRCWRTADGIGHRFDDDTYDGDNDNPAEWRAMCGAPIDSGVPDLDEPVDCMTCLSRGLESDTVMATIPHGPWLR